MFVFGGAGRPGGRFNARVATFLVLGVAVAAAAQWHRHPAPTSVLRQSVPPPPYTRPCPIDGGDVVAIVDGGGSLLDSEQARQLILLEEARQCGRLVAQDPDRVRPSGASPSSAEVRAILADVNRAICPESSCTYERPALESDVIVVRAALRERGFANAQVRFSTRSARCATAAPASADPPASAAGRAHPASSRPHRTGVAQSGDMPGRRLT